MLDCITYRFGFNLTKSLPFLLVLLTRLRRRGVRVGLLHHWLDRAAICDCAVGFKVVNFRLWLYDFSIWPKNSGIWLGIFCVQFDGF